MSEPMYPIGAASKLTGLSSDSIRSWERRYDAIHPARAKGGRLYTEKDIHRLRLLKRAVDSGHAISQISPLTDSDLESLPVTLAPEALESDLSQKLTHGEVGKALACIENYDALAADRILGKMAILLPPRDFVHDIVTPLMGLVSEYWAAGRLSVAQEHLACSLLRNILGAMMRLQAREDAPSTLLFATLADELHEFGILAAAMLAVAGGLGVLYLGPNLPEEEIARAVKKVKVRAVVLGFAHADGAENSRVAALENLRRLTPAGVDLILGGRLTPRIVSAAEALEAECIDNFRQFEERLKKFGARY